MPPREPGLSIESEEISVRWDEEVSCYVPVSLDDAELLCQTPEQISLEMEFFVNLDADLDVCGVNLEGCRQEIVVIKGNKWRRLQNLLTAFAIGAFTAIAMDAAD